MTENQHVNSALKHYLLMKLLLSLLLAISSFLISAQEHYVKGTIYQIDSSNNFAAAIKSYDFSNYHVDQESTNWCWAACIEMVLKYQGLENISQCDIVYKTYGNCDDHTGNCSQIINAADGWLYAGEKVKAKSFYGVSGDELINTLAKKHPVIVGLDMPPNRIGHALVLTAIFYRESRGKKIPYMVRLRDPWPYEGELVTKELEWNDFRSRINCLVYVTY